MGWQRVDMTEGLNKNNEGRMCWGKTKQVQRQRWKSAWCIPTPARRPAWPGWGRMGRLVETSGDEVREVGGGGAGQVKQ